MFFYSLLYFYGAAVVFRQTYSCCYFLLNCFESVQKYQKNLKSKAVREKNGSQIEINYKINEKSKHIKFYSFFNITKDLFVKKINKK